MADSRLQERIHALRTLLEQHNKNYYENDTTTISDAEYDCLFQELLQLEQQHPSFNNPHSPTQRIGGKASRKFSTVAHKVPMLSLDNAFSEQELTDFIIRLGNLLRLENPLEQTYFCAEPKLDGLALSLHYQEGNLIRALTRGDGTIGEDVTHNAKAINDIPLTLSNQSSDPSLPTLEVRGEVFMSKSTLEKLNHTQQQKNEKIYANARNFAAGTLRQLDPQIVADRGLNFYAYNAISTKPICDSHYRMLKMLSLWGLPVNPEIQHLKGLKSLLTYYHNIHQKRPQLNYEIDGIVYKLDPVALQNLAGNTQRAPRWAIAHKFPSRQSISQIKRIDIQIGRTGVLTPVARLTPTVIGGVTIRNATLHNLDEIQRKNIRPLDEVFIRRAGDVIPEVVKLANPQRTPLSPPFSMPKTCPSCGSQIIREKQQAHFRCTNSMHCRAQRYQNICHFISRKAMNIDGLGKQRIQQLLDQQLIDTIADLYTIGYQHLEQLPKMKEQSINNTLQSIATSKDTTLPRFLYAIGMHEVGEITAYNLAQSIENNLVDCLPTATTHDYSQQCLQELQNLSTEQLMEIDDIGPTVAKSIHTFMQNTHHQNVLQQCIDNGVSWQTHQHQEGEKQLLRGETIVLTGTLQSMSRELAKQKLQSHGAKVTNSVSQNTTIVIAGANAGGNKINQAEKLNITIWDESKFLKNINSTL